MSYAMLSDDMALSILMVYAKHIEESNISMIIRVVKRECSDEQGKPKSKKRFYNKISSIWSKDRVAN